MILFYIWFKNDPIYDWFFCWVSYTKLVDQIDAFANLIAIPLFKNVFLTFAAVSLLFIVSLFCIRLWLFFLLFRVMMWKGVGGLSSLTTMLSASLAILFITWIFVVLINHLCFVVVHNWTHIAPLFISVCDHQFLVWLLLAARFTTPTFTSLILYSQRSTIFVIGSSHGFSLFLSKFWHIRTA